LETKGLLSRGVSDNHNPLETIIQCEVLQEVIKILSKVKMDQKCLGCARKLLVDSEKRINLPNLRKVEILLLEIFNNSSPSPEN